MSPDRYPPIAWCILMASQYLLPCHCGQELSVEKSQAGTQVECDCGEWIEVPVLRKLTTLRKKPVRSEKPASWSRGQGILFVCGVLLLIVGTVSSIQFYRLMPPPNISGIPGMAADLDSRTDSLGAAETLRLWNFYQDSPNLMVRLPGKIETAHNRRSALILFAWVLGFLFLLGSLLCFIFALRGKRLGHST